MNDTPPERGTAKYSLFCGIDRLVSQFWPHSLRVIASSGSCCQFSFATSLLRNSVVTIPGAYIVSPSVESIVILH